jgi:hypothetical protein
MMMKWTQTARKKKYKRYLLNEATLDLLLDMFYFILSILDHRKSNLGRK